MRLLAFCVRSARRRLDEMGDFSQGGAEQTSSLTFGGAELTDCGGNRSDSGAAASTSQGPPDITVLGLAICLAWLALAAFGAALHLQPDTQPATTAAC